MSIFNANTVRLGAIFPNLPNMSPTLESWFQPITIGLIAKTLENNRVIETTTDYPTRGVLQPLSTELLEIKPEGQRSWKWYMLHCQPSLSLRTDDTVTIREERYRVMGRSGYSDYGYIMYELVQDYETAIEETP